LQNKISALLEYLIGLNRQADGDFPRAVEHLKDLIAEQTVELALGALPARQLNAPVTGVAFWADDIRLAHSQNMQWGKVNYQPIRLSRLNRPSNFWPVSIRHEEILNVMPYIYGAVAFIGVVAVVFISLVALARVLG